MQNFYLEILYIRYYLQNQCQFNQNYHNCKSDHLQIKYLRFFHSLKFTKLLEYQNLLTSFQLYKFDQQLSVMIAKQSYWNWDNLMAKEIMASPMLISKKELQKEQFTEDDYSCHSPIKTFQKKNDKKQYYELQKVNKNLSDSYLSPQKQKKNSKPLKSEIKIKIKNQWQQSTGICKSGAILFFSSQYDISKISKLKLYPTTADKCSSFYLMKMIYDKEPVFFGLPLKEKSSALPTHFKWFLRIITQKMKQQVDVENFQKKQVLSVASSMKQNLPTSSRYCGYVFKKSQYLGKWSKRWLIVKHDGIHSFNTENHQETFFVPAQNIKYIWTRFETINDFIIIKLKHGVRKTQFAVPLYELLQAQYGFLYQIYQLMMINANTST